MICILCRKDLFGTDAVQGEEAKEVFDEHMSEAHQAVYEYECLFTAWLLD